MLNDKKVRDAVSAIEEYRLAYWEHKDPQFVKEKRYRPLVSHVHSTSCDNGAAFTVSLYDTWIDLDRPGHFFLGREQVDKSQFTNKDLVIALQELLNFARVQFMNDQLFESIQV